MAHLARNEPFRQAVGRQRAGRLASPPPTMRMSVCLSVIR